MSFNIVDAIQAHVSPDELQKVSTAIGEPSAKTRSAMSTGVLGIVGSLIHRGSSPSGAAGILKVLKYPSSGGAQNLAAAFLGDRAGGITEVVAKTSGMSSSSAHRVMAALLPLAAGVLGKEVTSRGLSAEGLSDLFRSQKEKFYAIPGASMIAGAIGMPAAIGKYVPELTTNKVISDRPAPDYRAGEYVRSVPVQKEPVGFAKEPNHSRSRRWWIPAAAAAGALAIAALAFGTHKTNEERRAEIPASPVPEAIPNPVPAAPALRPVAPEEPTSRTTTTGAELPTSARADMPKGSLEEHFGAKSVPDKLTLEDVTFDFATANLNTGKETIEKVAVLMKQHPSSTLRVEGHTDSVGREDANEALSLERAAAVKKMLVADGVDAKRIEAVGMGERTPVAPNDTAEGRAKNRRIDAVIIKR